MSRSKIAALSHACVLVVLAAAASPAAAQFNVSQYPLYVQKPVKPAFIMAVDDSGSMKFETLFPGRDGQGYWHRPSGSFFIADGSGGWRLRTQGDASSLSGFHGLMPSVNSPLDVNRLAIPPIDSFGFARAPKYNSSWYDPEVSYRPWKRGDGTEYANSTPTDAREDPRNASPRFNLTTDIYDQTDDADTEYLTINQGGAPFSFSATNGAPVILEAGWQVRNVENSAQTCGTSAGNINLPASSNGTWLTITSTRTLTNCATFHIQRQSAGRINHVNEMFTVPVGATLPAGTQYYRFALRQLNGDGDFNDVIGGRYESSLDPGNNNRADSCGGLGADRMQRDTWVTLAAPLTVTDATYSGCRVGLRNYMPTFYLPADAPAPAGYNAATRVLAIDACGTGCNLYRYEIRSTNYTSAAVYNEQIQNFANWYTYYGNRNRAMISGMTRALADVTFMRVGFFRINNLTDVVMNDLEIQTARNNLYNNSLLNLPAGGSTPNRQAVNHLGAQFMRAAAAGGAVNPPQPFLNPEDGGACQVNGGMLFTDGYSNQDGPSVGNQDLSMGSPFKDDNSNTLADIAAKYYLESLQPGFSNQAGIRVPVACADSPDPWVDCQEFPHMNFYGVTLGAKGNAYGVTHAIDPNDWTEGFTNPPAWPARENDLPSTVDDIWHAAVNTRGRFINATSPAQITQAMRDVLLDIASRARPAGGVAASGSRIGDGFLVYVPEYFSDDWTGDVKAYRVNAAGALVLPAVWSAGQIIEENPSSRGPVLVVNDGLNGVGPFNLAGLGGAAAASTKLNLTAADFTAYGNRADGTPVGVEDVVNYLAGSPANETRNGGNLRSRRYRIGDILNSQPALTTAGPFPYTRLTQVEGGGATGAGSYGEYLAQKRAKDPVLFVGANDGMLHAIDSTSTGGDVLFSIVPNSVVSTLKELPKRTYSHRFYVDGSPQQADVRIGGSWRTYLFSANGAGGKSVMALDVTDAATSFSASDFKWEFQNPGLGHALHAPRSALLEGGSWVTLVANGPNSVGDRARMFVLSTATGAVQQTLEVGTGSASDPNGLTSVFPADSDGNGKIDIIYGGDLHGNVWKFSVAGNSISVANAGSPLFVARDSNGERQPITGALEAALHHISGQIVFAGTGKYFEVGDGDAGPSAQVQTFYGLWDKNDDSSISGRGQLQEQTLGETTVDGDTFRTVSRTLIDWETKRGWFIDLSVGGAGSGERFIGRPRVLVGNVMFTSYLPQGDICNPGGVSRVYVMGLLTGSPALSIAGCTNCAGTIVATEGAPVASPPVVVESPRDGDREGIDVPHVGVGPLVNPDPAPGCVNRVKIILSDRDPVSIMDIDCGRLSWRQIQ